MSSWLRVMTSYLSRFSAPEIVASSTGELIEIVIGMIYHTFDTSMLNTYIGPREIAYNELIVHFVNLESTITIPKPEEQGSNKNVKFDKDAQKGEKNKNKHNNDKKYGGLTYMATLVFQEHFESRIK